MIKEHEKQNITKIPEDDLQRYIRRILQRFFETEGINSRESKEAMIVESIRRYKEFCKNKGRDWLIGLNGMTGLIYLSITVLGGELKINHHTAFNKDFGDQADTICEGNDPRLSDAREPLEHVHLIQDIEGLEAALDSIGAFHYYIAHSHFNIAILNKIIYSGPKDIIDVAYLEQFVRSVRNYVEQLLNKISEIDTTCSNYLGTLETIDDAIIERVKRMEEEALNMVNWIEPAKEYARDRSLEWIWEHKQWFRDTFFIKEDIDRIENQFLEANKFICDGEIPIVQATNAVFGRKIIEWQDNQGDPFTLTDDFLRYIYNNSTPIGNDGTWHWDTTRNSFVEEDDTTSYAAYLSTTKFGEYIHRVRFVSRDTTVNGGDDDIIGTVICALDDGSMLTLDCSMGDTWINFSTGLPCMALRVNGNVIDRIDISAEDFKSPKGWKDIVNGVSVLIKRTSTDVKVWYKFNESSTWSPSGDDINPSDPPALSHIFTGDTARFSARGKYGYSCESQPDSFYQDVWFRAIDYDAMPIYSNLEYELSKLQIEELPADAATKMATIDAKLTNKFVKTYFRWDNTDGTHEQEIPFSYMYEKHTELGIQCSWNSSNQFIIYHAIRTVLPETDYECDDYYAVTSVKANSYEIYDLVKSYSSKLYRITDDNQLVDMRHKLPYGPDKQYFIDGIYSLTDNYFVDEDGNHLTYLDSIRTDRYLNKLRDKTVAMINNTWDDPDIDHCEIMPDENETNQHGYLAVYIPETLQDRFSNPRIYFQVYNTCKPDEVEENNDEHIS